MEKKRVFKGVATALITPLTEDGVDYLSFGRLIDWQIESGIDALVVCGTTGEASTLTDGEHRELISFAAKRAAGRVPVIAGTGSNDTSYAKELTLHANQAGADAVLAVTPYYNKCTQKGLVNLYTELADISKVPLIPYNVPTRTGINIEPKTYAALAEHPNITGFKEASGNISKIVETMSYVNGRLFMYSGNDDQIVPLLSLGGSGVISVISNLIPKETKAICDKFFEGDISGAANLQFKYHSLIDALFSEVNPIPIKAAMSRLGFCEDYLRLPLTPMEDQNREKLFAIMKEHGII
ncbi:MAG: 4-hydroxy-tetrahydrodipicolinate synthase [Eubacteriales bacterium]